MVGKDQLNGISSGIQNSFCMCEDFLSLGDRSGAGGQKVSGTLDFNKADTAGAGLVDILQVAESRDMDAGSDSRIQDGITFVGGDINIIDL